MKQLKKSFYVRAFFLIGFLCLTTSPTTFTVTAAATLNTETAQSAAVSGSVLVTSIQNEDALSDLPSFTIPLRTSPSGDNMENIYLLALEHRTVSATVTADGESREEIFSVAWDFSSIDQTVPGEYAAVGRIELPAEYTFQHGVLQELKIPVLVKELPPAAITSVESWYPYTNAFAFLQGTSMDTLSEAFSCSPYYLECYDENGDSYSAEVTWDFSGIDLNTVGLYSAKGSLVPPENTVFADGLSLPEISIPVSVQAFQKPDINCLMTARGRLLFPYVTPPGTADTISVWLSENDGAWVRLEDGIDVGTDMLSLSTFLLTYGSSYRLQVDYDGSQTGILSFTYADEIVLDGYYNGDRDGGDAGGSPATDIICPMPETPVQDGEAQNGNSDDVPADDTGGSTDDTDGSTGNTGGFTDGTGGSTGNTDGGSFSGDFIGGFSNIFAISLTKPSLASSWKLPAANSDKIQGTTSETIYAGQTEKTQDPVSPSSLSDDGENRKDSPSKQKDTPSENTAFSEFFSETTDRIFGTRLLMMLQTGNQNAVFSKQGITVSIPKDALPDTLNEDDVIEVTIKKKDEHSFVFLFSINGTAVSSLSDVLVMIPYSQGGAADNLYLSDETGAQFAMTDFDDTTKTASFLIRHTGTYSLTAKETPADSFKEAATSDTNHWRILFVAIPVCLLFLSAGIILLRRRRKQNAVF